MEKDQGQKYEGYIQPEHELIESMEQRAQQIKDDYYGLINPAKIQTKIKILSELDKFRKELTQAHPNYNEYFAWHALGGSTINPDLKVKVDKYDLPDEFSIEKFVADLVKKYGSAQIEKIA